MSTTPKPPKAARRSYSHEVILEAIQAVKGGMTVTAAAKDFGIPRQTLKDKLSGKYALGCAMGRPSVFSPDEEQILVDWIVSVGRAGFPVSKDALLMSVKKLAQNLHRQTPFSDSVPGEKWYNLFLNRHPEIAGRMSQALTTSRANVSETDIRNWFGQVNQYVESQDLKDVFKNPSRIFNCDETAFFLCPKDKKVLVKRGERHVYSITGNDEKECLTALIMASANGTVAPPMVGFSYERIPFNVVMKFPEGWGIGKTENGWMTSESFFEYISNIFDPWLEKNKIQRPVVLFVDGHSSHITYHLSEFCTSKKIELIALYPNSTHVLQPLDVALFHPLKACWRKIVQKWRYENGATKIKKEDFAPLLKQVLDLSVKEKTLENGFLTTGLSNLNPENVDFAKVIKSKSRCEERRPFSHSQWLALRSHLDYIEAKIGEGKVAMFKKNEVQRRDESLYELWLQTKTEVAKYREALEEMDSKNKKTDKETNAEEPTASTSQSSTNVTEPILGSVQVVAISDDLPLPEEIEENAAADLLNLSGLSEFPIELELPVTDISLTDLAIDFQSPDTTPSKLNPSVNHEPSNESLQDQQPATPSTSTNHLDQMPPTTPSTSTHDHDTSTPNNNIKPSYNLTPTELKSKVPSPFKNALFWPGENKNPKKAPKKIKLPSAITSNEWKEYYLKKEEEKKAAEVERERKKQLREAKAKIKKEKIEKTTKRKRKDSEEEEEKEDDDRNTNDDFGVAPLPLEPLQLDIDHLVPSQWVVVPYCVGSEKRKYVGQIMSADQEKKIVNVKFLSKKLESDKFVWPKKDDIDDVPFSEILQILREPTFDRWGYLSFEDLQL